MAKTQIEVQGLIITIERINSNDYISLTDIAKQSDQRASELIRNWMKNSATLEYLTVWEELHNPNFNSVQMDAFKLKAAKNRYIVNPKKYIEETGAIGLISKAGKYGGTIAHKDIAFNFCWWLEPAFQLYVVKEFDRLKEQEAQLLGESWNIQRLLTKSNFHIQTAAIRENLVPLMQHNTKLESFYHASELDQLNMIIFGMTAKEWKQANPKLKGNIRDHANKLQLVILNNLQAINAVLIEDGMKKNDRASKLLKIATTQMQVLLNTEPIKALSNL